MKPQAGEGGGGGRGCNVAWRDTQSSGDSMEDPMDGEGKVVVRGCPWPESMAGSS